jgi:hypothetical protein
MDESLLDRDLVRAWLSAAEDLGIDVIAPFVLPVDDGEVRCVALLREFGHRNGMLVRRGGVPEWKAAVGLLNRAVELGYGVTHVGRSYSVYERDKYIDLLNDWGWHGNPDAAPDWYTREPRTT